MDPLAAAAAAANNQPPIAAAAAAAAAAPAIVPPSYDIDYETATSAIGTLPPLLPRPTHANIRALERTLFERLETLQAAQSEEWGFRGLAEQPAEYALKSATPWVDSPNPGPHRAIGLNAKLTRDAEATYAAQKAAYLAQATVTCAIIAALNIAVPKQFKRGTTAIGGAIIGAASYRSNHDPRTILLALRTTYGIPTPAERQANDNAFATPWNPNDPIESYFDRLEDCYVAAVIASPPYTMEQMINRAIMAIQLTGLYSQALIDWNAMAPAARTWDALKSHFTTAYIVRITSGTGTTASNGYHGAANAVDNDDTLNNIESTLNHELSNLHLANNANHQSTLASIAELRAALATTQQQLAMFTAAAPATVPPTAPYVPIAATTPTAPPTYQRNNNRRRGGGRGGGRGGYDERSAKNSEIWHKETRSPARRAPTQSSSSPTKPSATSHVTALSRTHKSLSTTGHKKLIPIKYASQQGAISSNIQATLRHAPPT
jgi:hypothetical protein